LNGSTLHRSTWRFPGVFWTANTVELLERMAFYGMFISLTLYLSDVVGFTDVEAGWVDGAFAALIYLLPPFAGAWADRIGFRKALIMAFTMLAAGYGTMGVVAEKWTTIAALTLIAIGGSFIKSLITGTVAKTSDKANRARAFSIFYFMVNIGAFMGKGLAYPLRINLGLSAINLYSAAACVLALFVIYLLYRNVDAAGEGKSFAEIGRGFMRVVRNIRYMALIVIVSGFWAIQHQMYATMPKYVTRMVGPDAAPEWIANINPLTVMILVVLVTHLARKWKDVTSIGVGLLIIPFSALIMSLGPALEKVFGANISFIDLFSLHPVTIALVMGVATQGLAECFLSPRFLEYASKQAPEGETGLYMGYSHLSTALANILGFGLSGYLLTAWCPDPKLLSPEVHEQWAAAIAGSGSMPVAYAQAHWIWWIFAGIGFAGFFGLMIFKRVTDGLDARVAEQIQ